jgi:cation transport ATPase
MNLDELMSVWRTQDAAPLHDMNKTLLHLALRQDEAKLQKERRKERWIVYVVGTVLVAIMALFLAMIIYAHDHKGEVMTGWDLVVGIVGAAAVLIGGRAMYVEHRARARRDERFGESLRDQLNRRIAQLDYVATRALRTSMPIVVLIGVIAPMAVVLLSYRINQKPFSAVMGLPFPVILGLVWSVVGGVWIGRRQAREALARKHRLEELLKELDGK